MARNEDTPIAGHEYDGIRELDNPLPAWWLGTFFVTIIFGFIYWIHYQFGGALNQNQELEKSLASIRAMKKAGPELSEANLTAAYSDVLGDEAKLGLGKDLFAAKCAACHGQKGEGVIGPNLTDRSWLQGKGTRVGIYTSISEGVLAKGMPAWGEQLKPEEMIAVAGFVYGLRKNPVTGGRPPQGEEISE